MRGSCYDLLEAWTSATDNGASMPSDVRELSCAAMPGTSQRTSAVAISICYLSSDIVVSAALSSHPAVLPSIGRIAELRFSALLTRGGKSSRREGINRRAARDFSGAIRPESATEATANPEAVYFGV